MIYLLLLSCLLVEGGMERNCPEDGGICVTGSVLIGGPCTDDNDCVGDPSVSSECKDTKLCGCRDNFIPRKDLFDCIPIMNDENGYCEDDRQCTRGALGELSVCLGTKCKCRAPDAIKIPEAVECVPVAQKVTDPCKGDEQCKQNLGEDAECTPIVGDPGMECTCNSAKSVPRLNGTLCLKYVNELELEGSCEDSRQCTGGLPGSLSECLDDVCRCQSTAVNIPGQHKCLVKLGLDEEPCVDDIQCQATLGRLGKCEKSSGKCICMDHGVPSIGRDRCLPIVNQIGGKCEEPQQCREGKPGEHSDCIDDKCECTSEASKLPGEEICFKNPDKITDPCLIDDHCELRFGNWSNCGEDGKCACLPGSVENSDGTKCVEVSPINGPCDEADPVSCPEYSECISGRCQCAPGRIHSWDLTKCLPLPETIGGNCEERRQCQIGTPGPHSDCVDSEFGLGKFCQCTSDAIQVPSREVCFRKADRVGDDCTLHEQCREKLGHSYCDLTTHTCICETGHVPSSGRSLCLRARDLDQSCKDHTQCNGTEFASCLPQYAVPPGGNQICKCIPGYSSSIPETGNKCHKMAEKVGDSCMGHSIQCTSLEGAKCIVGGTDITTAYCLCDPSTEVTSTDGRRCLPGKDLLNSTCDESVQCRPRNSVCDGSRCVCPPDFVEFGKEDQPSSCLKAAMELRQPCEEDIQCSTYLGDLTECRLGRCDCSHRAYPYAGKCFVKSALGAYCQLYEECYLGASNYSYCDIRDNRCKCLSDAIESNGMCWDDKEIGDICSTNEECEVSILGPSSCQGMKCTCSSGYTTPGIGNQFCVSEGNCIVNCKSICFLLLATLVSSAFYITI